MNRGRNNAQFDAYGRSALPKYYNKYRLPWNAGDGQKYDKSGFPVAVPKAAAAPARTFDSQGFPHPGFGPHHDHNGRFLYHSEPGGGGRGGAGGGGWMGGAGAGGGGGGWQQQPAYQTYKPSYQPAASVYSEVALENFLSTKGMLDDNAAEFLRACEYIKNLTSVDKARASVVISQNMALLYNDRLRGNAARGPLIRQVLKFLPLVAHVTTATEQSALQELNRWINQLFNFDKSNPSADTLAADCEVFFLDLTTSKPIRPIAREILSAGFDIMAGNGSRAGGAAGARACFWDEKCKQPANFVTDLKRHMLSEMVAVAGRQKLLPNMRIFFDRYIKDQRTSIPNIAGQPALYPSLLCTFLLRWFSRCYVQSEQHRLDEVTEAIIRKENSSNLSLLVTIVATWSMAQAQAGVSADGGFLSAVTFGFMDGGLKTERHLQGCKVLSEQLTGLFNTKEVTASVRMMLTDGPSSGVLLKPTANVVAQTFVPNRTNIEATTREFVAFMGAIKNADRPLLEALSDACIHAIVESHKTNYGAAPEVITQLWTSVLRVFRSDASLSPLFGESVARMLWNNRAQSDKIYTRFPLELLAGATPELWQRIVFPSSSLVEPGDANSAWGLATKQVIFPRFRAMGKALVSSYDIRQRGRNAEAEGLAMYLDALPAASEGSPEGHFELLLAPVVGLLLGAAEEASGMAAKSRYGYPVYGGYNYQTASYNLTPKQGSGAGSVVQFEQAVYDVLACVAGTGTFQVLEGEEAWRAEVVRILTPSSDNVLTAFAKENRDVLFDARVMEDYSVLEEALSRGGRGNTLYHCLASALGEVLFNAFFEAQRDARSSTTELFNKVAFRAQTLIKYKSQPMLLLSFLSCALAYLTKEFAAFPYQIGSNIVDLVTWWDPEYENEVKRLQLHSLAERFMEFKLVYIHAQEGVAFGTMPINQLDTAVRYIRKCSNTSPPPPLLEFFPFFDLARHFQEAVPLSLDGQKNTLSHADFVEFFPGRMETLYETYKQAVGDRDRLESATRFMHQHRFFDEGSDFPTQQSLLDTLALPRSTDKRTTASLKTLCENFEQLLYGEQRDESLVRAFSAVTTLQESSMFSIRFRNLMEDKAASGVVGGLAVLGAGINRALRGTTAVSAKEKFVATTNATLDYLRRFVGADDVRISSFAHTDTFLANMQGKKGKGEGELELIAKFFREGSSGGKGDLLARLNAAFELRRYKVVLADVLNIVDKDLKLTRVSAEMSSPTPVQDLLDPVKGDFVVKDAPLLLPRLKSTMVLTLDELEIIRALRLPSAGLLLAFFRQNASEAAFRQALSSATEQATRNEHVSGLIAKLQSLYRLLRPFWSPAGNQAELSIADLKAHFVQLAGAEGAGQLANDLVNVVESQAEWGDYFVENSTVSSDIIRAVPRYLKSGDFFSCLSTHKNGAGLLLKFGSGREASSKRVLDPQSLQENAHWAKILSTSDENAEEDVKSADLLQTFCLAHELAAEVHDMRLFLEATGHPDFQSADEACISGSHLLSSVAMAGGSSSHHLAMPMDRNIVEEIKLIKARIEREKVVWDQALTVITTECPRLHLLNFRARVQFLLALRMAKPLFEVARGGGVNPAALRRIVFLIYPFVAMTFPSNELMADKQLVWAAIERVCSSGAGPFAGWLAAGKKSSAVQQEQQQGAVEDLQCASNLLRQLEADFRASGNVAPGHCPPGEKAVSPVRIELAAAESEEAAGTLQLYCQHLAKDTGGGEFFLSPPGLTCWCDGSTTDVAVKDLLAVARSGLDGGGVDVESRRPIIFVGVDKLLPRVRAELLRSLGDVQALPLVLPVVILFGGTEGSESFLTFRPEEAVKVNRSLLDGLRLKFWASPRGSEPNAQVFVVTGAVGAGKTRAIQERQQALTAGSAHFRFVVHEGFSPSLVIERAREMPDLLPLNAGQAITVSLHFDVTVYAKLEMFNKFLHHMLAMGLILDEETGACLAPIPGEIKLLVHIELPALQLDDETTWPPADDAFVGKTHPFLKHLPVLTVACPESNYIQVRRAEPYKVDPQSSLLAKVIRYLHPAAPRGLADKCNFCTRFTAAGLAAIMPDDPAAIQATLETFFRSNQIPPSKRLRSQIVELLHDRIVRFDAAYLSPAAQNLDRNKVVVMTLDVLRTGEPPSSNTFSWQVLENYFKIFVLEAVALSGSDLVLGDNTPFVIWPLPQPNCYLPAEVLISTRSPHSQEYAERAVLCGMGSCGVSLNPRDEDPARSIFANVNVGRIRALIAPAFGMKGSADLIESLAETGHVLTCESLVRLMHLNTRRFLRSSVLYVGETGCGKSQNLHLFSKLVNNDTRIFVNVKQHLLAIVEEFAKALLFLDGDEAAQQQKMPILQALCGDAYDFSAIGIFDVDDSSFCETLEAYSPEVTTRLERLSNLSQYEVDFETGDYRKPTVEEMLHEVDLALSLFEPGGSELLGVAIFLYLTGLFDHSLYDNCRYLVELKGRVCVWLARNGGDGNLDLDFSSEGNISFCLKVVRNACMRCCDVSAGRLLTNLEQVLTQVMIQPDGTPNPSALLRHTYNILQSYHDGDEAGDVGADDDLSPNSPRSPRRLGSDFLWPETADICLFIQHLCRVTPGCLYHRKLADEGLTPAGWRSFMREVSASAIKARVSETLEAVICCFVDELNTAGCMGLITEAFLNHSMDGVALPSNIVFVGAINPLRQATKQDTLVQNLWTTSNFDDSVGEERHPTPVASGVAAAAAAPAVPSKAAGGWGLGNLLNAGIAALQTAANPKPQPLAPMPVPVPALAPRLERSVAPNLAPKKKTNAEILFGEDEDYNSCAPYIVQQLPPGLVNLQLLYPNLDASSEELFLMHYWKAHVSLPPPSFCVEEFERIEWQSEINSFSVLAVRLVCEAQRLVREAKVPRVFMSIRQLIRATHLFKSYVDGTFYKPTRRLLGGGGADGDGQDFLNIVLPRVGYEDNEAFLVAAEAARRSAAAVAPAAAGKFPENSSAWVAEMEARPTAAWSREHTAIKQKMRQLKEALIMTITVCYYWQLPGDGHPLRSERSGESLRAAFLSSICFETEIGAQLRLDVANWTYVVRESVENLFSHALTENTARGIAKTSALLENFYGIVVASTNKIPIMITGPPGCGKTMAFSLACDCLRGEGDTSVAFQHLRRVHKLTYQCSQGSSGPEIAAKFNDAVTLQRNYDRTDRDTRLVVLGFDEAGLVPENRQALKSLHDVLDERSVGTVMMSNTTLDAAKTSRTIQILQSQSSLDDLKQLAWGILVDEEQLRVATPELVVSWKEHVYGFCDAFHSISAALPHGKSHWFHNRDFIFACRMLRVKISSSNHCETLFSSEQVVSTLRRHFQTFDPADFPGLAEHFLRESGLWNTVPQAQRDAGFQANTLQSVRESLTDRLVDPTEPSTAHCRYTLIVDPTDSEASIDILRNLQMLDTSSGAVVYQALSDFESDKTPSRRAAVLGAVKKAIEAGATLILSNCAPLFSALYDVINRHYNILVQGKGEKQCFANIALGQFSRSVRVHPSFRLIVIISERDLATTQLPLLNRLEKYRLTLRDVLKESIRECVENPPQVLVDRLGLQQIQAFFTGILHGVEHFVAACGGSTSFYGISASETAPALVLRALEQARKTGELVPRGSVFRAVKISAAAALRAMARRGSEEEEEEDGERERAEEGGQEQEEGGQEQGREEDEEEEEEMAEELGDDIDNAFLDSASPVELAIRALNLQVFEAMRVESVFRLRKFLPRHYVREYIDRQEHFSCVSVIRSVMYASYHAQDAQEKIVLYTRSDFQLKLLGTEQNPALAKSLFGLHRDVDPALEYAIQIISSRKTCPTKAQIASEGAPRPTLCILQLAAFKTGTDCDYCIRQCLENNKNSVFLLIADMSSVGTSQVTFARRIVDETHDKIRAAGGGGGGDASGTLIPRVIFLLHISSAQLKLRPCYQAIPLNSWSSSYVDTFYDSESVSSRTDDREQEQEQEQLEPAAQGLVFPTPSSSSSSSSSSIEWIRVAFTLSKTPSLQDTAREFSPHLFFSSLKSAVAILKFQQYSCNMVGAEKVLRAMKLRGNKRFAEGVQRMEAGGAHPSCTAIYYGHNSVDAINEAKATLLAEINAREYIMGTIRVEFAKVWGKLLASTVENACTRLTRGLASRGLLAEVRSQHKWVVWDFMRLIFQNDLAADWALGAILELPPSESENVGGDVRVRVFEHVLKALISNYAVDKSPSHQKIDSNAVKCKANVRLLKTPLYGSLNRMLTYHATVARKVQAARRGGGESSSQINKLEAQLRQHVKKAPHLHEACELIVKNEALLKAWLLDYFSYNLELDGYTAVELEILLSIAGKHTLFAAGAAPSLLRWVLLEGPIRTFLFEPCQLIQAVRKVLSSADFEEIAALSLQGADASSAIQSATVKRLGDVLLASSSSSSPVTDEAESKWMTTMRDLLQLSHFSTSHELLTDLTEDQGAAGLGAGAAAAAEEATLFCSMMTIYRIVSLSSKTTLAAVLSFQNGKARTLLGQCRNPMEGALALLALGKALLPAAEASSFDSTVINVLSFFLASPRAQLGAHVGYSKAIIAGLLGLMSRVTPPQWLAPLEISSEMLQAVFANLSITARCELLKLALGSARIGSDDYAIEAYIEELLIGDVVGGISQSSVYLPMCVLDGVSPFAEEHVFSRPEMTALPKRAPLQFVSPIAHRVVFRAFFLLHLQNWRESANVDLLAQRLSQALDLDSLANVPPRLISKMQMSIQIMDLCQAGAMRICAQSGVGAAPSVAGSKEDKFLLERKLGNAETVATLARAVAIQPKFWGLYFLSLLSERSAIIQPLLLGGYALLANLNMSYWLEKTPDNIPAGKELNAVEAQKRADELARGKRPLFLKLVTLSYSRVLFEYSKKKDQLDPPSITDLFNSPLPSSPNVTEPDRLAHSFLCGSTLPSLDGGPASVRSKRKFAVGQTKELIHLPVVVAMHAFVRDKLALVLRHREEAYELSVTEAIARLPTAEAEEGLRTFSEFLASWHVLRLEFGFYMLECPHEREAFDNANVVDHVAGIPELTMESCRVFNLAEIESLDKVDGVNESDTARMIETICVKLSGDVLNLDASLRSFREDENVNRKEFLCEKSSKRIDVSMLSRHTPPSMLLTGPQGAVSGRRINMRLLAFENYLGAHAVWVPSSPAPPPPVLPAADSVRAISVEQLLQREQENAARALQTEFFLHNQRNGDYADDKLWHCICPKCGCYQAKEGKCSLTRCGKDWHSNLAGLGCNESFSLSNGGKANWKYLVGAPEAGKPPLKVFMEWASGTMVTAGALGSMVAMPEVPATPMPQGEYQVNWLAVGKFLLGTEIHGRLDINLDAPFFRPIEFAALGSAEEESLLRESSTGSTGGEGKLGGRTGSNNPHSLLDALTAKMGPGTFVFARLRVIAELLEAGLAKLPDQHLTMELKNDPQITRAIQSLNLRMRSWGISELDAMCASTYSICEYALAQLSPTDANAASGSLLPSTPMEQLLSAYAAAMSSTIGEGLRKDLAAFRCVVMLPTVARRMAEYSVEGATSSRDANYNQPLSNPVYKDRIKKLREELAYRALNGDDLSLEQKQLTDLGSELAGQTDKLRNFPKTDKKLRELPALAQYLQNLKKDDLGVVILGDSVMIKNFDVVCCEIRRILGEADFNRLTFLHNARVQQAAREISVVGEGQAKGIPSPLTANNINSNNNDDDADDEMFRYKEYVPPEFVVEAGGGAAAPAAAPSGDIKRFFQDSYSDSEDEEEDDVVGGGGQGGEEEEYVGAGPGLSTIGLGRQLKALQLSRMQGQQHQQPREEEQDWERERERQQEEGQPGPPSTNIARPAGAVPGQRPRQSPSEGHSAAPSGGLERMLAVLAAAEEEEESERDGQQQSQRLLPGGKSPESQGAEAGGGPSRKPSLGSMSTESVSSLGSPMTTQPSRGNKEPPSLDRAWEILNDSRRQTEEGQKQLPGILDDLGVLDAQDLTHCGELALDRISAVLKEVQRVAFRYHVVG